MIGSQAAYESFDKLFGFIYKEHAEAKRLSMALLEYVHLWDDFYDADKDIEKGELNRVMLTGLTVIAGSPLWGPDMQAHAMNAFYKWSCANEFEKPGTTKDELSKAWMLRAGIYDMFIVLAGKLYGPAWGCSVAPIVYRHYGETLDQFLQEKGLCQIRLVV